MMMDKKKMKLKFNSGFKKEIGILMLHSGYMRKFEKWVLSTDVYNQFGNTDQAKESTNSMVVLIIVY
ncbi:hypothetical protein Avbf_14228 [Armadillidium vulgare]|nr:hypothetical protein Avbf_14228 [Armadillidium vulgare]